MSEVYAELIGDPVAHSLSPAIHQHWLDAAGIVAAYRARKIARTDLTGYLAARKIDPLWRGCNVTMPLKDMAARLAARAASTLAARAANVLLPRDDDLLAINTDVAGVRSALAGLDLAGQKVAIIGKGGAAAAAIAALEESDAELQVISREAGGSIAPETARARIGGAALVINATPLGMAGAPPMPRSILDALATAARNATAFDMVYQPLDTPFLAAARAAALRSVDGLTMLIGQAREAFQLFFGVAPPPGDDELRTRLLRGD